MSGLYNMLFGRQSNAPIALALLGKSTDDFMRFRDAWLERDDAGTIRIAIYTRMGGGNREHGQWDDSVPCDGEPGADPSDRCWGCWVKSVSGWPGYLDGQDDEFDCTYRTFYFAVPEKFRERVDEIAGPAGVEPFPVDMDARWHAMIDSLGPRDA